MTLTVRLAKEEDANAARACVVAAFDRYTERIGKQPGPMLLDFVAEIKASHTWVAQEGPEIVGVLVQYETKIGFYIHTVAAHPARQGQGVGRAMLIAAEDEACRRGYSSIYLCTNSKMTENLSFYPRIGYVEYERKHEGGYDRVFFAKAIASSQTQSKAQPIDQADGQRQGNKSHLEG